jgi:hypothetical protein
LQLRASGQSWYGIAKHLNAEGIKTKTGKDWVGGTVCKLLHSRTVIDWLALRATGRSALNAQSMILASSLTPRQSPLANPGVAPLKKSVAPDQPKCCPDKHKCCSNKPS